MKWMILFFAGFLFAEETPSPEFEKLQQVNELLKSETVKETQVQTVGLGSVLLQLGFGLLVVGVLIWLAVRLLKFLQEGKNNLAGQSEFHVLRTFYLNPKQKIQLVEIFDKKYLLGVTEHSIQVLDDNVEVGELVNSENFSQNVDQFLERFKRKNFAAKKEGE